MRRATVVKYSSIGSETSIEAAERRIAKAQEKYPDREYIILTNARAYGYYGPRLVCAQVRFLEIDIPEEDIDYRLLPQPDRKDYPDHPAFDRDYRAWVDDCEQRKDSKRIKAALKGPMN